MQSQLRIIRQGGSSFCRLQSRKEEEELEEMEVASQSLRPDVSQIPSNGAATTSRRPLLLFMNLSIASITNQQGKTASL